MGRHARQLLVFLEDLDERKIDYISVQRRQRGWICRVAPFTGAWIETCTAAWTPYQQACCPLHGHSEFQLRSGQLRVSRLHEQTGATEGDAWETEKGCPQQVPRCAVRVGSRVAAVYKWLQQSAATVFS